jgi:hypothetical protein
VAAVTLAGQARDVRSVEVVNVGRMGQTHSDLFRGGGVQDGERLAARAQALSSLSDLLGGVTLDPTAHRFALVGGRFGGDAHQLLTG